MKVRMERRGRGRGDPKYNGGNGHPETGADGAASAGKKRPPLIPRLGYKKLEEMSKEDPSLMVVSLSNHPGLQEILNGTQLKKELIELLCLVLSKALRSRADRSTLQHLAAIVKGSKFFCVELPFYLAGVDLERNLTRREQYPGHLGNIVAILSEVNRRWEGKRMFGMIDYSQLFIRSTLKPPILVLLLQ